MRPILFVDRDGTLIEEPADCQIDAFEKLRFVEGAVPALCRLRDAGYRLVMVSNQDGLGTPAFPQHAFDGPHALVLQVFASQGVAFEQVLIDRSLPAECAPTRKPGIGLALPLLRERDVDWARSAVVGDRDTDLAFADNLGIRGFQLRTERFGGDWDWEAIAHALVDAPRTATVARRTRETAIRVRIDLDRAAEPRVQTGLAFFDHMLEQIGKHAGIDLDITADGDLAVDEHHTVEDTALALGQALREALGDKRGIGRYGFVLPMDEALASAALDLGGRAMCVFQGDFHRERVGALPTELVPHFFRSLCDAGGFNLHLQVRGENDHHQVEACFKAFARALRQAVARQGTALPSTKGVL
ncbi:MULTISPECIES: bifunctional histidinol-phosphatase/imidazoleglycerol-phosphate dehydratase HisB [Luteimonas]|jgi:imidazoleglycerol-phosphate dehydratase/histidinol-phosphatase|uniref:Histidine biosynthesis bifunctional protein HisB n=1 Tax=Luteimonas notoginsengisoli TaxID=1578200 RepID=A0ABV7UR12_9GAMM